jgi:O-antigen/teichoic acid export membrane protein
VIAGNEVRGSKLDGESLDKQFARGLAWTAVSRTAAQVVSWSAFLVVVRTLSPGDFGIVAAATSVVGLVTLVAEFGLGTAIVAKTDLTDHEVRQLVGVAALTGALAWAVCAALGWPAAFALRVPELITVLPVVGVSIALATLNAVPAAMLRRSMAFRSISQFEMGKSVLGAIVLLALALAGWGFWAPITGELVSTFVMTCLLFRKTKLTVYQPRWATISGTLTLSRVVLLSRAAWYAYSNADVAVVSRRLGKSQLGDYYMAWTLINLPTEKVATLLFAVTPSVFAKVRDDLVEFRRYVLLLFESLALILMPISAGIGVVAADAVAVLAGDKWQNSAPLVQALALYAVVKSVAPLSAQILIARGNAAAARRQSFLGLAILPISFVMASKFGALAVALVWATVFPVLAISQLRVAAREIELPMSDILLRLIPIVVSTAAMAIAVLLLRALIIPETMMPAMRLTVSAAAGALVYAATIMLLAGDRARVAITFVRRRG